MSKGILVLLLLSLGISLLASLLASSRPDGLDRVAIDLGFSDRTVGSPVIMSENILAGTTNKCFITAFAGLIGIFAVFGIFWGASKIFGLKGT